MIIIGQGKHAQVAKNIAIFNYERYKVKIISYEQIKNLQKFIIDKNPFIIAVGDNLLRRRIYEEYPNLNYVNLIHPFSSIAQNVKMGIGNLICPGVIIQPHTIVGNHCIINTKASIDHHNIIGNYVHICPNVTCCGTVKIDSLTTIGPSSTVTNNTSICKECIVGASSLVLKDITIPGQYWGTPCKLINKLNNIR